MKTYRSARALLAEVEQVLAGNKPSFHRSPLDDVIELLCQGRRYGWVGIYLVVGEKGPQQLLSASGNTHPSEVAVSGTRLKILVAIQLAGRELGVLSVESDREHAFGAEDRVMLERVAHALARFLAGPGKYLVRKAREGAAGTSARVSPNACSQAPRSAAAGEK